MVAQVGFELEWEFKRAGALFYLPSPSSLRERGTKGVRVKLQAKNEAIKNGYFALGYEPKTFMKSEVLSKSPRTS